MPTQEADLGGVVSASSLVHTLTALKKAVRNVPCRSKTGLMRECDFSCGLR